MKDAGSFDFYPERWTHGTRHMTKVERCDYHDLLCHQWTEDGLPADLTLVARLIGYRKASQIPISVLEKFPLGEDGRRRNLRLEIERQKQRARIAAKRDGAQKTNAKRWSSESLSDGQASRSTVAKRVAKRHFCESPPGPPSSVLVLANANTPPNPQGWNGSGFDQFWRAYPRKEGKANARKAFHKALKTTSLETILSAITNQQKSDNWTKDDGQFIPHPASWLNGQRWDDELTPTTQQLHSKKSEYGF